MVHLYIHAIHCVTYHIVRLAFHLKIVPNVKLGTMRDNWHLITQTLKSTSIVHQTHATFLTVKSVIAKENA